MIQITLSEDILAACPDLHVLAIACRVRNTESDRVGHPIVGRDCSGGGNGAPDHEAGRGE